MKQEILEVTSNIKLTNSIYKMELVGDCSAITNSGQFVNILVEGFYLRRPISVNDYSANFLTIIYKVVGKGTTEITSFEEGKEITVLGPLGNGFDFDLNGKYILVSFLCENVNEFAFVIYKYIRKPA